MMIDVHKNVYEVLQAAGRTLGVGVYRRPGAQAAELTPFVVFAISSLSRVNNSDLRHGMKFTLTLNLVAEGYHEATRLSYRFLEILDEERKKSAWAFNWSHMDVTSGPEDASTSLSATELDQMTMTLEGVVRRKNHG